MSSAAVITPIQKNSDVLICFSHLRWNFVFQRPQHLLSRATRQYRVLFFEEPTFENVAEAHLQISRSQEGVTVVVPVLPNGLSRRAIAKTQQLLVNDMLAALEPRSLITWYYTPAALEFSSHIQTDICVYDCMDELSAFKGAARELADYETSLFTCADVVFTGGRSLFNAKKHRHPNIHAFPSSIDFAHFSRARTRPQRLRNSHMPRVGYFGVIDERMDLDLVAGLACSRPDWQIEMVGPVVKIDPLTLPQAPNINWVGSLKYADLPERIGQWDVGFMPFAINGATRFISPTKTPEFLAAGCPVVSTPIGDVVNPYGDNGLVEIAANYDEVVAAVERLLVHDRGAWLALVDKFLAGNSWDRTWTSMNREVKRVNRKNIANRPHTNAELGDLRV